MKKTVDEIEIMCRSCEHAEALEDGDYMLCDIHGAVKPGGCCRKFVYDVLKRVPPKSAPQQNLEYVDIDN